MKIINISQRIKRIEKDKSTFQGIMDEVRTSDAALWAFPLYLFFQPASKGVNRNGLNIVLFFEIIE